jgi:hypothetical protein
LIKGFVAAGSTCRATNPLVNAVWWPGG